VKAGLAGRWARVAPLALVALLFVALLASGELRHLSIRDVAHHRLALERFVARHPVASVALYAGLYLIVVVACLPGPSVMSIAGGLLFGVALGGSAALGACVVGAAVVFLACRTAFGDWAASRAGPRVARIEAGFARDALPYLLALRLMPVAPFFLVNIAAGLARIPLVTFVVATLVGAAPSCFVFASLGAGLRAALQRQEHFSMSLLARDQILAPLGLLALMALAPVLWRLWRARRG